MGRTIISVAAVLCAAGAASAAGFAVSTDRVSYTGEVTRYGSLADAQAGMNSVSGPHAIPARAAASPFDTGSRDVAMYFVDDYADYDADQSWMLTAWYYTTSDNTNALPKDDPSGDRLYSGWGNPNNTNTGFVQFADQDNSSAVSRSGSFGDFDGTYFTSFTLQAELSNLGAADFARLWAAPILGGAASITGGNFVSASLDITFGGLEGSTTGPGVIEAFDHPDSVMGTFSAIFENTGSDGALNGYYRAEFTFNMDSWAYGQGDSALNGDFTSSYFATVPAPGAAAVLGLGALIGARRRRA